MKLLLDTHAFIWLNVTPERLSPAALSACGDVQNQLLLSVVSGWEIQIKSQIGRLALDVPLEEMISVQQADNGLGVLAIELSHVYALSGLPPIHNDPFDRLLIVQAKIEQAQLVSADNQIKKYPVEVLW